EVELVGGDEQPVARLAALGGRVLHDQVLAGGALHGALHHLDVAADAVVLVDDVVARGEGQRVERPAAAGRHAGGLAARGLLAGEVGLGEDGQPQLGADEAVVEGAAGDVHHGRAHGGGVGQAGVGDAGGDAL